MSSYSSAHLIYKGPAMNAVMKTDLIPQEVRERIAEAINSRDQDGVEMKPNLAAAADKIVELAALVDAGTADYGRTQGAFLFNLIEQCAGVAQHYVKEVTKDTIALNRNLPVIEASSRKLGSVLTKAVTEELAQQVETSVEAEQTKTARYR